MTTLRTWRLVPTFFAVALLAAGAVVAQPVPAPPEPEPRDGADGGVGDAEGAGADGPDPSDAGGGGHVGAADAGAALPDAIRACLAAFASAQAHRRASQLVEAREELVACGQEQCPAVVRSRCVSWLGEIDAALPTLVIVATDARGDDAVAVRSYIDGALLRPRLDGKPMAVNPGVRRLRLELAGHLPIERRIVVAQGDKDRPIRVQFVREDDMPVFSPGAQGPVSETPAALAWTGFSVAAAGATVGTITGIVALVRGASLADACPGGLCPRDEGDALERGTALAHASTASFALGGVGLVLGIVGLALSSESPAAGSARSQDEAPKPGVELRPFVGRGAAGVEGRF